MHHASSPAAKRRVGFLATGVTSAALLAVLRRRAAASSPVSAKDGCSSENLRRSGRTFDAVCRPSIRQDGVVVDRARVGAAASALLAAAVLAGCGSGGSGRSASKSTATHSSSTAAQTSTATASSSAAAVAPAKHRVKTVNLTVEVNGDLLVHTAV